MRISREQFIPGVCAVLAIAGFFGSQSDWVKGLAVIVGSSCISYATTTLMLRHDRERAARIVAAEAYLRFLRQLDESNRRQQSQRPVACRGCSHYHGKRYGGNLLICAMHPYGVDDETCGDWMAADSLPNGDRRLQ